MDSKKDLILTERQALIYDMYYNQGLTQKDISIRLKISQQAISKSLKKSNKKKSSDLNNHMGLYKRDRVIKGGLYKTPKNKVWRIHALIFIIKPFYFFPRYHKIRLERGNYGINHGQFTIMLYEDSVRIQSKEGISWRHEDKYKAVLFAEQDFNDFLKYVSKIYGFNYEKEGRVSIKQVSGELALEGSEFSEEYRDITKENTLRCKDRNGKVCFIIDQSTGKPEHEYIGKNSFNNSEKFEHYLNDFLYNQPLTNSQIASRINDLTTVTENIIKIIQTKL